MSEKKWGEDERGWIRERWMGGKEWGEDERVMVGYP